MTRIEAAKQIDQIIAEYGDQFVIKRLIKDERDKVKVYNEPPVIRPYSQWLTTAQKRLNLLKQALEA